MMTKPNIVEAIQREGIPLKRKGRLWWALCPLHTEKTPSFCVDTDRQRFKCFGCGEGGDSIDFVMKMRGLSFRESCDYLRINDHKRVQNERDITTHRLLRSFRQWEDRYKSELCDRLRLYRGIIDREGPESLNRTWPLVNALSSVERELEVLENGDDEARFQLFCEVNRQNERF
jgi:hypothetical protein